eukprot:6172427-Pleurochrysis_carterae.AAC.2
MSDFQTTSPLEGEAIGASTKKRARSRRRETRNGGNRRRRKGEEQGEQRARPKSQGEGKDELVSTVQAIHSASATANGGTEHPYFTP